MNVKYKSISPMTLGWKYKKFNFQVLEQSALVSASFSRPPPPPLPKPWQLEEYYHHPDDHVGNWQWFNFQCNSEGQGCNQFLHQKMIKERQGNGLEMNLNDLIISTQHFWLPLLRLKEQ